jgi:hypothetical protein
MGDELERVAAGVRRINALALALVCGLVAGFVLFLATNVLLLKGGAVVGPHLALLGQFFPGYRVSFLGSLVGFAWAFGTGFVFCGLAAWIYNGLVALRHGPR